jgi:vacuolar protein sorting-associated protein 29
MNSTAELVLVVGDMNVPFKFSDIPTQFKNLLIPNKIQHVLSLGNMGSKESYDWLKSLSNDFHAVKGEYDETNFPETKVITIGEFKIGMIHGHQVTPFGDLEALSVIQRQLNCDILLSGHTHSNSVNVFESKYYINPGSISGAFSYNNPDPIPSFILMVIQGDFTIVYLYELLDENKKFEVTKMEFTKNSNELKNINDKEEEDDEEGDEDN